MADYLLDTHAVLYWLFDDARLSSRARSLIANRKNRLFVSAASAWEIATKHRLGKLPDAKELVRDMPGWFERAGFVELPISVEHAQHAGLWPQQHRDPFDRMIAAQSDLEGLAAVSNDEALGEFPIEQVW
ncbi:MAG: type II toxin-antitoxin system VapC family toxin [Myxococcaceae bacterium]